MTDPDRLTDEARVDLAERLERWGGRQPLVREAAAALRSTPESEATQISEWALGRLRKLRDVAANPPVNRGSNAGAWKHDAAALDEALDALRSTPEASKQRIPVAPEVADELTADWSPPVQIKIEDGELICRACEPASASTPEVRMTDNAPSDGPVTTLDEALSRVASIRNEIARKARPNTVAHRDMEALDLVREAARSTPEAGSVRVERLEAELVRLRDVVGPEDVALVDAALEPAPAPTEEEALAWAAENLVKPSPEDAERAVKIAQEKGWADESGRFKWDEPASPLIALAEELEARADDSPVVGDQHWARRHAYQKAAQLARDYASRQPEQGEARVAGVDLAWLRNYSDLCAARDEDGRPRPKPSDNDLASLRRVLAVLEPAPPEGEPE